MPGRICAVSVCKSNQMSLKKKGAKIVFHCFPKGKDSLSSAMRKEWVRRCRRRDKFNIDASAVCSEHFTIDDYERDLQHELLNLPLRKVLKKTAVPTANLGYEIKKSAETLRSKRALRKENKKIVASMLVSSGSNSIAPSTSKHEFDVTVQNPTENMCDDVEVQVPSATQTTEPQTPNYKMMYEELLHKYSSLKTESRKKIKTLDAMQAYYKNKYYNPSSRKYGTKSADEILRMVLTQNQIDLLSKRKKLIHWTQEELSVALTLRYFSKECYLYVRNVLKYPLPAPSSLRRWESSLDA